MAISMEITNLQFERMIIYIRQKIWKLHLSQPKKRKNIVDHGMNK